MSLLFARYAARAKRIKTKPVVVMVSSNQFELLISSLSRFKKSNLGQSGFEGLQTGVDIDLVALSEKTKVCKVSNANVCV